MKASIEVKDSVIIRRFIGDVYHDDVIKSWNEIFSRFENLNDFKGIVTDMLDAEIHDENKNLNRLVEYLKEYTHRLKGMKMAVVRDTHLVCNTILLDRKIKQLQIRPFTTRDAAMGWIVL